MINEEVFLIGVIIGGAAMQLLRYLARGNSEKTQQVDNKLNVNFEQFTNTTTLVNVDFDTYGEIYVWEGKAVFDIKTICLTITDMEAIVAKMREIENKSKGNI